MLICSLLRQLWWNSTMFLWYASSQTSYSQDRKHKQDNCAINVALTDLHTYSALEITVGEQTNPSLQQKSWRKCTFVPIWQIPPPPELLPPVAGNQAGVCGRN